MLPEEKGGKIINGPDIGLSVYSETKERGFTAFDLSGSVVPMVTPGIEKDGVISVDEESINTLVRYLLDGGSSSIFCLGTTGEFRELNFEQKKTVVRAVISSVRSFSSEKGLTTKIPILVGISGHTPDETAEFLRFVNEQDVQAVVVTPLYGEGDPDEKVARVLALTKLPVMLYDNPTIQDGKSLSFEQVEKWKKLYPQIIGIKDSNTKDQFAFRKLLKLREKGKFHVLQGSTSNAAYMHTLVDEHDEKLEVDGVVCHLAIIHPNLFARLCRGEANPQEVLEFINEMKNKKIYDLPGIKQKLVKEGILSSSVTFGKILST